MPLCAFIFVLFVLLRVSGSICWVEYHNYILALPYPPPPTLFARVNLHLDVPNHAIFFLCYFEESIPPPLSSHKG